MQFLIDADLPRAAKSVVESFGYQAIDVRDIGMAAAKDAEIIQYARKNKLCLLTGDFDFSNIRDYPPRQYAGIVVLKLPDDATASYILNLLRTFLEQTELVSLLYAKLAIVEPGRVRIRTE